MESVKQIAGYPNVKGKAEVGKTAAAKAQVAAKTMSAIPQTSDDMPVTALAAIALAGPRAGFLCAARSSYPLFTKV